MTADSLEPRFLFNGGDGNDLNLTRDITSTRSFREAIAATAERDPDETLEAYAVRVFARLSEVCSRDGTRQDRDVGRRRQDWAMNAGEAMESGRVDEAACWLWRLIADRPSDADAWLLYAAFCARHRHADGLLTALACVRRAVSLNSSHRLALFALAAILMSTGNGGESDDSGNGPATVDVNDNRPSNDDDDNKTVANDDDRPADELESTLRHLLFTYPRFAEAHFLAAVHSCHAGMPSDRTVHLLSLARQHSMAHNRDNNERQPDPNEDHDDAEQLLAALSVAWPPVRHGGDEAVGCAALLITLGLVDLAAVCVRSFAVEPDVRPSYQYLMAVVHHKRGEFDACADHLAIMPDNDEYSSDGRRSLLTAHNDYGAGRTREAMARYAALLSSRPKDPHYGLAYSRRARHLTALGEHAEAADGYLGACVATRTPALLTELAVCLVTAIHEGPATVHDGYLEAAATAERLLCEAVALDGDCDGNAWHSLAMVYETCGHADMADACNHQAFLLEFGPADVVGTNGLVTTEQQL